MNKEIRKYQEEAVSCGYNYYKKYSKGQLIMACGTGKTYTSYLLDKKLKNKLTLIFFPSLDILNQFHNVWTSENTKMKTAIVNSEYDISKQLSKSFINSKSKKVVFATYQSINKIIEIKDEHSLKIDFIICDEAHRVAIGEYSKLFKKVHTIESDKVLFMTATPKDINDTYSMSNEEYFGKVFYRYDFNQAIQEKYLSDYELFILGLGEFTKEAVELSKRNNHSTSLNLQALSIKKIIEQEKINKMIVFSKNRKEAYYLYQAASKFHKNVFYIDGNMSVFERAEVLNKFKKCKKALIFNCKCLIEGIDDDSIDSVYFVDDKKSAIEIIQSGSRPLRRKKGKIAKIFVPIVDFEKISKVNNSFTVEILLKAFEGEMNSVLSDSVFQKRKNSKSNTKNKKNKIHFLGVEKKVAENFIIQKIHKSKRMKINDKFEIFIEYLQNHDFKKIANLRKVIYKDVNIGRVQTSVRKLYKDNKLSKERVDLLNNLGFELTFIQSDQFYRKVDIFIEYFKKEENKYAVLDKLTYKGVRLDFTLAKIRENYKKGRLRIEYQKALSKIGIHIGGGKYLDPCTNSSAELYNLNEEELLVKKKELLNSKSKTINCISCNNKFVKENDYDLHCSHSCKTKYERRMNYLKKRTDFEHKSVDQAKVFLSAKEKLVLVDTKETINCLICKSEVVKKRKDNIYCSDKCRYIFKSSMDKLKRIENKYNEIAVECD